jgi:adenylate/nucleoside-diphosphate kinase
MVIALTSNNGSDEIMKKLSITLHEVSSLVTKDLSNFVMNNTKIFFERFGIDTHFLHDEPEEWINHPVYNEGANIVAHINVVSDTAERGVKTIEEYNSILTKDEEQKQYLLQIVKDYKI